jgi:hypothetical protein
VRAATLVAALAFAPLGLLSVSCGSVSGHPDAGTSAGGNSSGGTTGTAGAGGGDIGDAGGVDTTGSGGDTGGGGSTGAGGSTGSGGSTGAGGKGMIASRAAIRPVSALGTGSATVLLLRQGISVPTAARCNTTMCLVNGGIGQ